MVILHSFLVLVLSLSHLAVANDSSVEKEKAVLRDRMLSRKQSFEQFLLNEKKREELRESRVEGQRALRQRQAEAKESARKKFKRPAESFPMQAYKSFLDQREQRRSKLDKARKGYVERQKSLSEIEQNPKYNIDGNKEYKL